MGWVKQDKFAWSLDQSYQGVSRDEEEDDEETQEDWVEQARITGEDAWVDYADYDDDDDVDGDDDKKEVNERQDSFNYSNNISINGREHTTNEQQHTIERRPLHGSGGGQNAGAEQGTSTANGGGARYGTNGPDGTVGDARSH
jgi:hypothetical protein